MQPVLRGLEEVVESLSGVEGPESSPSCPAPSSSAELGNEAVFEIVDNKVRCRYPFGMSPWCAATALRGHPQAATGDILIALRNISHPEATWDDWRGAYLLMEGAVVGQKDLVMGVFPLLKAAWDATVRGDTREQVLEHIGGAMGVLGSAAGRPEIALGRPAFAATSDPSVTAPEPVSDPTVADSEGVPVPRPVPEGNVVNAPIYDDVSGAESC